MENIRFRNSRVINWYRRSFLATYKMKTNFATITNDSSKLEKLVIRNRERVGIVAAAAGNTVHFS